MPEAAWRKKAPLSPHWTTPSVTLQTQITRTPAQIKAALDHPTARADCPSLPMIF
jgi:hypothetical protein